MITSHSRGHEIYYDGTNWRFLDTHQIEDGKRSCKRCGKHPTLDGCDSCIGRIADAVSACCGHGVEKPYAVYE